MHTRPPRTRAGFARVEACAASVALALGLLLAAIAERSRARARCGEDLSHLRQASGGTASYAADFSDRFWHFSWTSGNSASAWPDLVFASDERIAHCHQMADIIRRHGRTDFPNLDAIALLPNLSFSHLVLLDYLNADIPSRMFVAAGDPRREWADDPFGYDAGLYTPNLGTGGDNRRHPYAGSFRPTAAFIDDSPAGVHMSPAGFTSSVFYYTGPSGTRFRGQPLSSVAFPSQKVVLQDTIARYFGTATWYSDPRSRAPALMADGAAAVRAFVEANPGANPNSPGGATPTQQYAPNVIEPPAANPPQVYPVSTLWTRMMLLGRDFGGPPVYP